MDTPTTIYCILDRINMVFPDSLVEVIAVENQLTFLYEVIIGPAPPELTLNHENYTSRGTAVAKFMRGVLEASSFKGFPKADVLLTAEHMTNGGQHGVMLQINILNVQGYVKDLFVLGKYNYTPFEEMTPVNEPHRNFIVEFQRPAISVYLSTHGLSVRGYLKRIYLTGKVTHGKRPVPRNIGYGSSY